jgi:hypothetical protein
LRYGERTARGTARGTKDTWALTLRDRRRARSGKKIMVSCDTIKDIALFRLPVTSAPDKKINRGRIDNSGEWERTVSEIWARGKNCREAAKVTRPQSKDSHDDTVT